MGLEAPRLDDRSFEDIVEEAIARIQLYAPEWTDHNMSDPGITLIELFAWMMDVVLYRLNRVPDKHYIKFMELIGMQLHEAVPARADVSFWLSAPQNIPLTIPADTQVATTRTESDEAIIFTTDGALTVLVPELKHFLTSFETDDGRQYMSQDIRAMETGLVEVPLFASSPPRDDDAFYLGFDQDLSNHLIGIQFVLDKAEGAGVDPENPPYVWEVLNPGGQTWTTVIIDEDTTMGMNTSGLIRVHLPRMVRGVRNDVSAYWLRCRLNLSDSESYYVVSPEANQLNVQGWGGTVSATNVTRVSEEVIGRSDGTPGQTFFLTNVPLVARTTEDYLIVRLQDGREQRWQEVSDFSTSTAADRHYTIDSTTGEVRLGPALPQPDGTVRRYGAIAPKDAMLVMTSYRFGGGQVGNVAPNTINVLRTSIAYVDSVRNLKPATGGVDAEALENAKLRVPGYLRSLQRAVTASDYEYLAEQAVPGRIGRVYCLQPPLTSRGENLLLVIPSIPILRGFISPQSLELPDDVREQIIGHLDDRRLLSTKLEVSTPYYQWIETEIRFQVSAHFTPEKVKQDIEEKLFTFLNPLTGGVEGKGWPFGRDLLATDVMAALAVVPGVNFIRSVKLFPVSYDNRQFKRGEETVEIPIPSHGVVVSYQHNIEAE